MRVLAILTLVLALSGQPQTPHNSGNIGKTTQPETTSNTKPTQQPALIPKEVPAQHPQDETYKSHQDDRQEATSIIVVSYAARRDWIDYSGLFISFVLVCITGTGVLAAWRGLPEILRQAKAAEDAAIAAKKSADSQINIERPWLLIEGLEIPRFTIVYPEQKVTLQSKFTYIIRNYGKTPAKVRALNMRLEIGDSVDCPPSPTEVFSSTDFVVNPHIIPQNDERPHTERLHPHFPLTPEEQERIAYSRGFLWAYGFVRYEDVHGEYETRICYRYNPISGKPEMDGPPEYNNAT